MESEQHCEMIGDQASLRAAICGIAPPCGDKECEFGFKRNENNCQDSCDCVEDDKLFLMGDIIVREETKPFVLRKYQVKSKFTKTQIQRYFKRSGGAPANVYFWDNIRRNNKYKIPYTISDSLRLVFKFNSQMKI